MSDDLVKRLREGDHFERVMSAEEAADRIEALERWQSAVFMVYENIDLDIESNPDACAVLKGENDDG